MLRLHCEDTGVCYCDGIILRKEIQWLAGWVAEGKRGGHVIRDLPAILGRVRKETLSDHPTDDELVLFNLLRGDTRDLSDAELLARHAALEAETRAILER